MLYISRGFTPFDIPLTGRLTMAILLGLLLLVIPTLCLGCYAPPLVDGPECPTGPAIFGNPHAKVHYSVSQVNNVGTLLCCKAWGCRDSSSTCRSMTWHQLGCSNSADITGTLPWGNNLATPKVKCKGTPFGTMYSASS